MNEILINKGDEILIENYNDKNKLVYRIITINKTDKTDKIVIDAKTNKIVYIADNQYECDRFLINYTDCHTL